jgi:hypothetical protein
MVTGSVTSDGSIVFTGEWLDYTTFLMRTFIAKYNTDLELEWMNLFPELDSLGIKFYAYGISETNDGDFLIVQSLDDPSKGPWDRQSLGIIKTDAHGELIFNKILPDTFDTMAGYGNLTATDDGHFIITAFAERIINPFGHFVGLMHKIDADGNIVWSQKELEDGGSSQIPLSSILPDGGAVMAYSVDSAIIFDDGYWLNNFNVVYGYDGEGNNLWRRDWIHRIIYNTRLMDLSPAKNGDVLGCGYWGRDSGKGTLGWLFRLNPETGEPLWERHYSDSLNWPPTMKKDPILLWRILELEDGRLALTGWKIDSTDYPGSADGLNSNVLLMVLDSMGCLTPGCDGIDQVISSMDDWTVVGHQKLSPLLISPNPARGSMSIRWPIESGSVSIGKDLLEIYDMQGQRKYSDKWDRNNLEISLSGWPAGQYTVLCLNDGVPVAGTRVVVIE